VGCVSKLTYANIYAEGLSDEATGSRFDERLAAARETDTRVCPIRIDGAVLSEGAVFERRDPSDRSRVVSRSFSADKSIIDRAVSAARSALPRWRAADPSHRTSIIEALLPLLDARREDIAALLALEVGKARADAIVEVDEAIEIVRLSVEHYRTSDAFTTTLENPGNAEWSGVVYRPYGVFGIIAPFNFPLAIPVTMLVSALLTGNTVVFKPSALTPACGDLVFDLFQSAGVPDGVLCLIQGDGDTGSLLAESAVDGIGFTGSAEVGLSLVAKLSQPPFVRPVIAEMGGKNPAVISDKTGDIAAAARAVARSTFGMTGQKCTACSRAIVFDNVYDEFVEAVAAEAKTFVYADPSSHSAVAGPVVNDGALERYRNAVETAKAEGRVVVGGGSDTTVGNFVEPTVIDGLTPGHRLTRDELFLPILSIVRVHDIDEAISEANAIPFGLSAGVFTDDADERAKFLDEIEAGIVFVNHAGGATTGVWPGNQTMSGWKASGTTGKGGFGPYYLQQFVREQSRTIY
jgi:1-pyrroline-5-carboxylate dehydrogenase